MKLHQQTDPAELRKEISDRFKTNAVCPSADHLFQVAAQMLRPIVVEASFYLHFEGIVEFFV